MNRAQVAADIAAQIEACFGGECIYRIFRARAVPPAECDSIALVWGQRTAKPENQCLTLRPCDREVTQDLQIVLTKCCVGIDAEENFDIAGEDHETICFEDDLQILEECIECTDWSQLGLDHDLQSLRLVATERDPMVEGGCVSAYLTVEIIYCESCPAGS